MTNVVTKGKCVTWRCGLVVALGDAADNGGEGLTGNCSQAQEWLNRYPQLVGVSVNRNSERTNAIFGRETRCIAGRAYLLEQFAGLEFQCDLIRFSKSIQNQLRLAGDYAAVEPAR